MLPLQKAQTYFYTSCVKRWVFSLFSPTKLFEILISCQTPSYLNRSISKHRTCMYGIFYGTVWPYLQHENMVWYGSMASLVRMFCEYRKLTMCKTLLLCALKQITTCLMESCIEPSKLFHGT